MHLRERVRELEASAGLPAGSEERFSGYGVLGVPFQSGHVLAMRRFPASSVGPGYSSVWHRSPDGAWAFYADVGPRQACTRFFGAAASDAIEAEIRITWPAPSVLEVSVPSLPLEWRITAGQTAGTRLMNAAARFLPEGAWRSPSFLAAMGAAAGPLLGVGRVGLHGRAPNGQSFTAAPRVVWAVVHSRAMLAGEDLGPPGPVEPQARLGDFWIPQRGILAIGQAYFEPFDSTRHSQVTGARSAL